MPFPHAALTPLNKNLRSDMNNNLLNKIQMFASVNI